MRDASTGGLIVVRLVHRHSSVWVCVAAAALACAGVAGAGAGTAAATPSLTGGARSVSRLAAARVGTSDFGRVPAGRAARFREAPLLKPPAAPAMTPALRSKAPVAAPAPRSPSGAAQVVANFDGLDAADNLAVSGFDLEPPDEGLAAGNGYVVNFVNVVGAVYSTSGRQLQAPFYLNTFFGEPAAADTSDPRVYYDPSSRRWFATIVEYGLDTTGTFTESHVDLATSTGADPTKPWRLFQIPTSDLNHAGCPCLADYPILAVDTHNVYVSTNEYTADSTGFNGAQLYAISKWQLTTGSAHANVVDYQDLSVAGTEAYHVQPANTTANSANEYLMSSLDPYGTADTWLAVWALTDAAAVTSGGIPTLSVTTIASEGYSFPPNAVTPPGVCTGSYCGPGGDSTTGVVATDFDALQEVQYINGVLVSALNTGVAVPGDTGESSGVAWFVVRPHVSGGAVDAGTRVIRQGYVAQNGEYLLYPHLNMTDNGSMALVFGLGGPSTYLSAAYATAPAGGSFGQIRLAAAGVDPDNGVAGTAMFGGVARWGDYSNGEIVAGANRVWLATQYIPNSGDGNENWGNRIFELQLH